MTTSDARANYAAEMVGLELDEGGSLYSVLDDLLTECTGVAAVACDFDLENDGDARAWSFSYDQQRRLRDHITGEIVEAMFQAARRSLAEPMPA